MCSLLFPSGNQEWSEYRTVVRSRVPCLQMESCCVDYFFSQSGTDKWARALRLWGQGRAPKLLRLTGKSNEDNSLLVLDNEESKWLPIGVVNRNMKKNARHKKVARLRSC